MDLLNNKLNLNKFEPLKPNFDYWSKPVKDVWFSNNNRIEINTNGYSQRETTSQGYGPNPIKSIEIKPLRTPIIGTLNPMGQIRQVTPAYDINNGYIVPRSPF